MAHVLIEEHDMIVYTTLFLSAVSATASMMMLARSMAKRSQQRSKTLPWLHAGLAAANLLFHTSCIVDCMIVLSESASSAAWWFMLTAFVGLVLRIWLELALVLGLLMESLDQRISLRSKLPVVALLCAGAGVGLQLRLHTTNWLAVQYEALGFTMCGTHSAAALCLAVFLWRHGGSSPAGAERNLRIAIFALMSLAIDLPMSVGAVLTATAPEEIGETVRFSTLCCLAAAGMMHFCAFTRQVCCANLPLHGEELVATAGHADARHSVDVFSRVF